MINAIPVTQLELPVPAQVAPAPPSPVESFSKVKRDVFEALGLKKADMKEMEGNEAAQSGAMAPWLSMYFTAQEIGSTPEQSPQLSKCSDPVEGIAGILEGFGLLNAEGQMTDEAQVLLNTAVDAASAAPVQPEASPAGMPPVQPDADGREKLPFSFFVNGENAAPPPAAQETAPGEAVQPPSAPHTGDDLRSLENAHSPAQPQTGAQQDTRAAAQDAQAAAQYTQAAAQYTQVAAQAAPNDKKASAAPEEKRPGARPAPASTPALKPEELVPNRFSDMRLSPEAVHANADGAIDAAPARQPVNGAETVMDLVESMYAQSKDGASEFEVTLKPEYLGKLSIKLTQDADGLKAQIKAADASVRNLLQNELATLQAQLKEKGVEVTRIDIAYEAANLSFSGYEARDRGSGAQESKRRLGVSGARASAYGAAEATADALPQDDARLSLQGSSVEFSA
ncbi:MAG: flagellar hook-length control protein FliK [Clostridiaceae bacterium]